jgi:hypothetical protein
MKYRTVAVQHVNQTFYHHTPSFRLLRATQMASGAHH